MEDSEPVIIKMRGDLLKLHSAELPTEPENCQTSGLHQTNTKTLTPDECLNGLLPPNQSGVRPKTPLPK